jgi:hypothetical protein
MPWKDHQDRFGASIQCFQRRCDECFCPDKCSHICHFDEEKDDWRKVDLGWKLRSWIKRKGRRLVVRLSTDNRSKEL